MDKLGVYRERAPHYAGPATEQDELAAALALAACAGITDAEREQLRQAIEDAGWSDRTLVVGPDYVIDR